MANSRERRRLRRAGIVSQESPQDITPRSQEPRVRKVFNIIAAIAGVFGLGLDLTGAHPYAGVGLMALAVIYGGWELFTSPFLKQKMSFYMRVPLFAILGIVLTWRSWPQLKKVVLRPARQEAQSRLEVTSILEVPAQNNNTGRKGAYFNVFYENKGTVAATAMAHRAVYVLSEHLLSSQEEARYREQALAIPAPSEADAGDEIQPGAPPSHYFSVPDDDAHIEQFGLQSQDVLAGKKRLYFFAVMKYRDSTLPDKQIRITEFCGWFLNTFELWHNCGNRIYTHME